MNEITVNGRTFYVIHGRDLTELYSKEGFDDGRFHSAFQHKGFSWNITPSRTSSVRSVPASASVQDVAKILTEQDIANNLYQENKN